MNFKLSFAAGLVFLKAITVHGCSMLPPCGIKVESLFLTNVPGILQIGLNKYQDCDYGQPYHNDFQVLESAMIEVNLDNGDIRTRPETFLGTIIKEGLDELTMTTQPDLKIKFREGRPRINVNSNSTSFGNSMYWLRGLDTNIERYDDEIVSFYSEEKRRLFFIYKIKSNKTGIASCGVDERPRQCDYTTTNLNFDLIEQNSSSNEVLDSLNLVGLKVQCCLCIDKYYYEFDQKTILRKVSTLTSSGYGTTGLDPRNGYAYGVSERHFEGDVVAVIQAEPISGSDEATFAESTEINTQHLRAALSNQNP